MSRGRMEAFSDGVLAIVITIMVLKLKTPDNINVEGLKEIYPTLLAYILSYVYVGIYWVNHHHLLSKLSIVSGAGLWKNLHWLFWMSLIPTATEWMGLNPFQQIPALFYGVILFMAAISYNLLQGEVIKISGKNSKIAQRIGKDYKGKVSIVAYALAIIVSAFYPLIAYLLYLAVALYWIVPDRRLEKTLD